MTTFAEDLELGREQQRNRRDPAWCVLHVVGAEYGLDCDPLEEAGVQGPWYLSGGAVECAIRLLVQGAGFTQTAAAGRVGYSPGKAHNAWRPPELSDDELDLLDEAEELHGGPLT